MYCAYFLFVSDDFVYLYCKYVVFYCFSIHLLHQFSYLQNNTTLRNLQEKNIITNPCSYHKSLKNFYFREYKEFYNLLYNFSGEFEWNLPIQLLACS